MQRKRTIVAALACFAWVAGVTASAHADDDLLDTSYAGAHRLKIEGATVSGVGFGLNALGMGLLIGAAKAPGSCVFSFGPAESGPCGPSPSPAEQSQQRFASSLFYSGVAISISSYALMAVGLPIWHAGAKREHALRRAATTVPLAHF
ncbi:MAG TPA: hypothetical protein VHB97_15010 [Polyangia bacterium]|jgi:hypothetical protein|nr:hypothetical protein [Polyangia bacterium]